MGAFLDLPWPLSLLQLLKQQLVLWNSAAVLLLLILRYWRYAFIPAVLAGANYVAISADDFIEPQALPDSSGELTVVWANVVFNTPALNNALAYARGQNADLVLIGAFPEQKVLSDDFAAEYPYRYDSNAHPSVCRSASRLVALSRLALSAPEALPGPPCGSRQFLRFSLLPDGSSDPLQVLAAHLDAPLSAEASNNRNKLAEQLQLHADNPPYLLAGDFNAVPWSTAFKQLPGRRIGQATWETTVRQWQFRSWSILALAIPVDHFLVSDSIQVGHYEVGPDIGSIHKPIATRLVLDQKRAGDTSH